MASRGTGSSTEVPRIQCAMSAPPARSKIYMSPRKSCRLPRASWRVNWGQQASWGHWRTLIGPFDPMNGARSQLRSGSGQSEATLLRMRRGRWAPPSFSRTQSEKNLFFVIFCLAHKSSSRDHSGTPAGPSRDLREAERDRTDGCAFECVGRPGSCRGQRVN